MKSKPTAEAALIDCAEVTPGPDSNSFRNEGDEPELDTLEGEPKSIIMSMLSQLKFGMDLHKIHFPTFVLEPRSMLERITDFDSHPHLILGASKVNNELERFLAVLRFYLSGWHFRPQGAKKPFNPALGEMFRCYWNCHDSTKSYYICEQVSHHPPLSAYVYANPDNGLIIVGNFSPRPVWMGNSIMSHLRGLSRVHFVSRPHEIYVCTYPTLYARGILFGSMFLELGDNASVTCENLDLIAEMDFKVKGFFSGSYNSVIVKVKKISTGKVLRTITGKWTDKLYISEGSGSKELFLDVNAEPICAKIVQPEQVQDECESRRLWAPVAQCIRTRNYDQAQEEKTKVEESQRRLARLRSEGVISWHPKFFTLEDSGFWNFVDHHMLDEPAERLRAHLQAILDRRDYNFKGHGPMPSDVE